MTADDLRRMAPGGETAPPDGLPDTGPQRPRLQYVDNLRIALTALVVLHHVGVTYGNIPAWYYTEPAKDGSGAALDLFVMFNQAFFMGFFFMIAGYFTPPSYARKGARFYYRDRLKRLGIPLLVFLLLIRPLVTLHVFEGLRDEVPYWAFYLLSWDAGPMWFVEVLLVFAAAYVLVRRRAEPRTERRAHAAEAGRVAGPQGGRGPRWSSDPRPLRPGAVIIFTAALALATYLWRFLVPTGTYVPFLGLPTPNFLPQYASFFVIGVLAFRRGWPQTLSRAAGRTGFAVAAGATLVHLVATATSPDGASLGHGTWQSLAAAAWESTFAVSMVIGLTVFFREHLNRQGRTAAFLSRHAFAVYLIHPAVLVGVSFAFRRLDAPAAVKFTLVAALALPLCWVVAYAVRSLPRADRVL
ncbi:acyltransferase [Streptomyces sp. NBRC 110611]|uniref:acyltransferase family protein n=1 Tax=Streptomyces sp. NBRC 110611 TaxID=1621259 RepID=UPI0008583E01|nr:acyltransferase [Streptomyces sp. NBRC 110611]GAU65074.1 acyltransferase [Streptomyces sp. NBRC 110611]